jgi:hypothetical protein
MAEERPRPDKKKYLIISLIVVIILIGSTTFIVYDTEVDKEKTILQTNEKDNIAFQSKIVVNNFGSIVADLKILSDNEELFLLLEVDQAPEDKISDVFLSFSKRKGIYNQIRYINEEGMEVIRVNYNDGNPQAVPKDQLQFKGDRYYFQETFQLDREEVFVSPLDLNIEYGEIERPLKPIIRFGTPIFDGKGKKRGIVILNYLAQNLLDNLREASANSPGEVMLINEEGYWLMGSDPEDEWGFMFEDRKDKTFGNSFPEAWEKITSSESGQFHTEAGMYSFETIHPAAEALKLSVGLLSGQGDSAQGGETWKIVSLISQDVLRAGPVKTLRTLFIIDFLIVALNILFIFHYLR